VNASHPAIRRRPARALDPDSDLGDMAVTDDVGPLPAGIIAEALANGEVAARRLIGTGRVVAALLALRGEWRMILPETGPYSAFSGEADTGSREDNATARTGGSPIRYDRIGNRPTA
jgi:hypothetical protein